MGLLGAGASWESARKTRRLLRHDGILLVRRGNASAYEHGECSCPVGIDCKHVAALVLTAIDPERARGPARRILRGGASEAAGSERPAIWEESLGSLLGSGISDSTDRPGTVPLAIELTLSAASHRGPAVRWQPRPRRRLLARLVKQGTNGWIRGGLSWATLSSLRYYGDHVACRSGCSRRCTPSTDFVATGRATTPTETTRRSICPRSTAVSSGRCWTRLYAAGVRLVHGKKNLGDAGAVPAPPNSAWTSPTTNGTTSLAVNPVVRVDGNRLDVMPIRFIGAEGHGLVVRRPARRLSRSQTRVRGGSGWPSSTRAVPPQLQRMALEKHQLRIPATEVPRFRDEYYPTAAACGHGDLIRRVVHAAVDLRSPG